MANKAIWAACLGVVAVLAGRSGAQVLPNGVSAGDTTTDSTVLWTHSTVTGNVRFDISTDPSFGSILASYNASVTDSTLPVKADVAGLSSGTRYYYRAVAPDVGQTTVGGTFKTAAAAGQHTGFRFGVSGDWRGELAPYPAINNVASRQLDVFSKLGDTIYADYATPDVNIPQATTLADYRAKHNEVYSSHGGSNAWANLQQSTSILSMIDDHEVTDNFEGYQFASHDPRYNVSDPTVRVNQTQLFKNGVQSFHEYNAIRNETYPVIGDARTDGQAKLYRARQYGADAAVFQVDARSFRDEGLTDVTNPTDPVQVGTFLAQSFNPTRTMLGKRQLADLKADLLASKDAVTWKFIQVPEPIQNLGVAAAADRFEGYAAERTELLKFIDDNHINNVVFVSADVHGTSVNNLTYQNGVGQPQIKTNAFEITTGSVAFDAPFGPTVLQLAAAIGIQGLPTEAQYRLLPRAQQEAIWQQVVNAQVTPLGYSPIGLEDSGLNVQLLQGAYTATGTYGWTEFDVDAVTQDLLVTTYGIPYYKVGEAIDPNIQPTIVSQFRVAPIPEPTAVGVLVPLAGLALRRRK
jgi:alkaline phosphatase D